MRIGATAAASYAGEGYSTIFEGIVIPRWTLGTIRETLEAAGVPTSYAVLRAPQAHCVARVQEREGSPDAYAPGVLAALCSEFDDLEGFERHAIDVTGLDTDQAAAAVAARLEAGELAL
jgi:predicted kinase